ncbi:D-lactate dehydrogenase [Allomuricauda ruestringensis DSM 13258]|uniref:D-lactate dehydrogenase n=1 Tax=Allomuricauda ruestringensis (strain DSM 13258 / CIP 107369 / LMG 19739 / B1) TaxID=886377 RepID=G2PJ58_ALLRU|nr:2-hydroxyacid dehydrogenase [Allomuricauda ruestringensis]AEM71879.1 D-lactate dehydrogenase [Allomuricauda ruestringensis DSM 13258]
MKVLVYSAKDFEIKELKKSNGNKHKIKFVPDTLNSTTAVMAAGYDAVSIFSNDEASLVVLEILKELGVKYITLRSTGYNNVSVKSAKRIGLKVAYAPEYSPHTIAEHAVGLLLALNRKLIQANAQVKQHNFLLDDLVGFDLNGKTVGIVGTGRIGSILVKIFHAFGCKVVANDVKRNQYLENHYDLEYLPLEELCRRSDVISINVPLNYETHHIFYEPLFLAMKQGALLINTARGGIVKTEDVISALKGGHLGGYATDVYEHERGVFFRDNSKTGLNDALLQELIALPNVLLTPHQAFATKEALERIAETTIYNLDCWEEGKICKNELGYETISL